MSAPAVIDDGRMLERLHRQARADRWGVTSAAFAAALQASLDRAPADAKHDPERYLAALHLEDLALAVACGAGHEGAWEHFIREHRPLLYRAADALASGGGARDLADSLYADLFGVGEKVGERRSLFRYFQGRSSLATWVRAVLAQRFVDRVRSERRVEPLEEVATMPSANPLPDPDRATAAAAFDRAMAAAIARLPPKDRLRLSSYYAEDLTLAQTGRLLGEHEATVSRQLARTRRVIHEDVKGQLVEAGLTGEQIADCFDYATEDAGAFDLSGVIAAADRKDPAADRSE